MGDLIREKSDPRSLPIKWVDNGDGSFSQAVAATISGSSGAVDREVVVTPYRVKTAFTGASVGDTVTSIRVIDVTGVPTVVGSTLWYNETTQAALSPAPSTTNLEPLGATGLTNAQMTSLMSTLYAATGAPADTPATSDSGTFSIIALIKRGLAYSASLLTTTGAPTDTLASTDTGTFSLIALTKRLSVRLGSIETNVGAAGDAAASADTGSFSINSLIKRGLANWTTLLARIPASVSGRVPIESQGNVASGATDAGNPVKVGGRYSATLPTLTDGQRADMQTIVDGSMRAAVVGYGAAGTDGIANGQMVGMYANQGQAPGAMRPLTVSNMVFNNTSWDRLRGDANGLWTQGNVASGAADAGNPVKVGGRYNATPPTLTDGQRGDFQIDTRGSLSMVLKGANAVASAVVASIPDGASPSDAHLYVAAAGRYFNGVTWDRARGDAATGALVNTLATPGVARQLAAAAAGGSSASVSLTTTARRVSIVARGSDLRYLVGTGTVTALATSHYIMAGERIDIGVPASGSIAVLSATAQTGTLEITELL